MNQHTFVESELARDHQMGHRADKAAKKRAEKSVSEKVEHLSSHGQTQTLEQGNCDSGPINNPKAARNVVQNNIVHRSKL